MRLRFYFFLILAGFSYSFSQYAPNMRINSEIDQLIYRLASRNNLKIPENQFFQPLNYETIQTFLENDLLDYSKISSTEKYLVNSFNRSTDPCRGRMRWSSKDHKIQIKLHLKLLADINSAYYDSGSVKMRGIISPLLCGNLGNFSFYSGLDIWTEYRSDTTFGPSSYQPYDGIPYNLYGRNTAGSHVRSSDMPRGGIRFNGNLIQIETAIDYLKIGPATYFPLTLSGTAPPINYARGTIDLGVFNYTHVVGLLKAQKDKLKYLYVHRINADFLHSRLNLGINEVIVTGSSITEPNENDSNKVLSASQNRKWEWAYLIPFIPFKFVEHYVGDRDNAALSFDCNLLWPVNFRWYMEFFLDDILSPAKIFTSDWGNKWAATIGMQYFGSVFNKDLTINAEYSRVEPWVYTHFYGGSHRYTHFNQCLGSPLGPNSQAVILSMKSQVNKYNEIGVGLSSFAKNYSVRGGNLTDVFQDENLVDSGSFFDSTRKKFLGPQTKWSLRPSLSWNFNPFGLFSIKTSCEAGLAGDEKGLVGISVFGGLSF